MAAMWLVCLSLLVAADAASLGPRPVDIPVQVVYDSPVIPVEDASIVGPEISLKNLDARPQLSAEEIVEAEVLNIPANVVRISEELNVVPEKIEDSSSSEESKSEESSEESQESNEVNKNEVNNEPVPVVQEQEVANVVVDQADEKEQVSQFSLKSSPSVIEAVEQEITSLKDEAVQLAQESEPGVIKVEEIKEETLSDGSKVEVVKEEIISDGSKVEEVVKEEIQNVEPQVLPVENEPAVLNIQFREANPEIKASTQQNAVPAVVIQDAAQQNAVPALVVQNVAAQDNPVQIVTPTTQKPNRPFQVGIQNVFNRLGETVGLRPTDVPKADAVAQTVVASSTTAPNLIAGFQQNVNNQLNSFANRVNGFIDNLRPKQPVDVKPSDIPNDEQPPAQATTPNTPILNLVQNNFNNGLHSFSDRINNALTNLNQNGQQNAVQSDEATPSPPTNLWQTVVNSAGSFQQQFSGFVQNLNQQQTPAPASQGDEGTSPPPEQTNVGQQIFGVFQTGLSNFINNFGQNQNPTQNPNQQSDDVTSPSPPNPIQNFVSNLGTQFSNFIQNGQNGQNAQQIANQIPGGQNINNIPNLQGSIPSIPNAPQIQGVIPEQFQGVVPQIPDTSQIQGAIPTIPGGSGIQQQIQQIQNQNLFPGQNLIPGSNPSPAESAVSETPTPAAST